MHAALNSSKSCCSICVITKIEWLIKGGRTYQCTCSLQFVARIQNVTREIQGQEKLRWRKCKLKVDFVLFPTPQSKILCIKKSSFVLASISKKCKLKVDKNITLVQNISTGISSAILDSSYHALSRADGCVYTETWPRSLGIAGSVLGSNLFLVTIVGSQKYGLYTRAYTFFGGISGRKSYYKECFQSTVMRLVLVPSISCRLTSLKVFHEKQWKK